jgi:hypothetical protein
LILFPLRKEALFSWANNLGQTTFEKKPFKLSEHHAPAEHCAPATDEKLVMSHGAVNGGGGEIFELHYPYKDTFSLPFLRNVCLASSFWPLLTFDDIFSLFFGLFPSPEPF